MARVLSIFLVGEGPDDIGELASSFDSCPEQPSGYFPSLIAQLVGPTVDVLWSGKKVSNFGQERVADVSSALARKAHLAAKLASVNGAEIAVFIHDADNDFADRNELLRGVLDQYSTTNDPKWVLAVPKQEMEAWVLGDVAAMQAIGAQISKSVTRPERIRQAKERLIGIVGSKPTRHDYAVAGAAAQPQELVRTCPTSFEPFYTSFNAALSSVGVDGPC